MNDQYIPFGENPSFFSLLVFSFRPLSGKSTMIHDFQTPLALSFRSLSQHENIWRRYMTHTCSSPPLVFWSYFGCGKRIHRDRQAPWSPPPSPSPLLLTNPKLLSMVSSWPWRGVSPGRGGALSWLQALTCTPSKNPPAPLYSPDPTPPPSLFV